MPKVVDPRERRTELTDAAARVIARAGIEAVTMREVAAEAGWTTGALTPYFADKRALLLATFQASLDHRRSLRPNPTTTSATELLRRTLEGALPLDESRRRHWLVTLTCCTHAAADELLAGAQRDAYREFRGYVTELVSQLGLGLPDPARRVAERLIAGVDGIAIQALFDTRSWPPSRQRSAFEALLSDVTKVETNPRG